MQKIPLLLTRPLGSNAAFADSFPEKLAAHLAFIDCPLMRIVQLQCQSGMAGDAQAIFTSSNGVRFAPPALGRRAYCVGERTTAVAQKVGWESVCAGQTAQELIEFIAARRPAHPLYHFCGVHLRGGVVEALIALGLKVERVVLYDQELLPLPPSALEVLRREMPIIVPLFSPRAAAHFATSSPVNQRIRIVAMSEAVAQSVEAISAAPTVTSAQPTAEAMLAAIENLVSSHRLG